MVGKYTQSRSAIAPRFLDSGRALSIVTLVAALLFAFPTAMQAQVSTADIVGTVTDSSGAVSPNVKGVVTNLATGLT